MKDDGPEVPLNSSLEVKPLRRNFNQANNFLRKYTMNPRNSAVDELKKPPRKSSFSENNLIEINKIDKIKKSITKCNDKEISNENKCRKCWHHLETTVNKLMNSVYAMVLVLICTFFALFNLDLKLITCDETAEPLFILLNNIIFFILTVEFFLLIIFEHHYIGSFDFYLDFLAVLSLIPDTSLIMEALVSEHSIDEMMTTNHLVKASAASQAGAR